MIKKEKVDPSVLAERKSIVYWVLIGFVLVFMFWSPFQKALFNGNTIDFERPIYSSLVWSSIILFLISVYFFFVWKWKNHRDTLSVAVLLLPLTYLVALIPAASSYSATNMLYIQIMYAAFFMLGSYLAKNPLGNSILSTGLLGSGYVIVLFGLMNWLGNGKLAGSLVGWFASIDNGVYRDAVMTDANGLRLTSVFQYANSYAAYLIALLFAALFLVSTSKKWYAIGINALFLVPIIVSFFLTLSRGAIVVIPFILLIILLFQKLSRQIVFLFHTGLAFIASFVILQKITDAGIQLNAQYTASVSGSSWLLLISVSLVLALIAIAIQKYVFPLLEAKLERYNGKKFTNRVVPVAAILIGVLGSALLFADTPVSNLLPENVKNRLENINFAQHSVLERGTFYKDAVKLFQDYPLFGAGGGAWSALYEKYQNNPYVSRQAHNFFLQYLVEVGLVGLLVFLAFLAYVFYTFIRSYGRKSDHSGDSHFIYFIVAISLLIHSIIDFDLSYVYLGILVFLCMGAMVSRTGDAPFKWDLDKPVVNKTFPALLLVLSITMFFISVRILSANSSFAETKEISAKSNDYIEVIKPLNEAINLHPNHPSYVLQKVAIQFQVYNQTKNEQFFTEAQGLLAELQKAEPYNRQLVAQQINAYKIKGQIKEASDYAAAQIPNFPWDITLYEESMALRAQLFNQAKTEKNPQTMDANRKAAAELLNAIMVKMKELEALPKEQGQGRVFNVTPNIALSWSQIEYLHGDYAAASNQLKAYVNDQFDNAANRMIARWYLAALQKQNQNDTALYEKLIAKDPKEKDEIQGLLSVDAN